jgi:hypothetical protein
MEFFFPIKYLILAFLDEVLGLPNSSSFFDDLIANRLL